jgi:hypothetical protein
MPYGTVNTDIVADSSGGKLAPISSVFRNRIINGAMVIDQRNAGASVTPTDNQFLVDRWKARLTQTGKYSAQQNAGSVTPPVGFSNYLGFTSLSAYSVTSTDRFDTVQGIEGFNTSDLNWGTANAKTVTLSFQVYSSLTGTFGGALGNGSGTRSYPFTYTIPVANTWTTVSVTIAGDTTGTWVGATNGAGIYLYISLGAGSTNSGTAGSWNGNFNTTATGATSVVGTSGATFYITGVQLEVGSSGTGFEYRQFTTELSLCQRYFCKTFTITTPPAANTQNQGALIGKGGCASDVEPITNWQTPVEMRTTPTVTLYAIGNSVSANNQWTNGSAITTSNARAGGIGLGTRIIQIDNTGIQSGSAGSQFYIQATASAEL